MRTTQDLDLPSKSPLTISGGCFAVAAFEARVYVGRMLPLVACLFLAFVLPCRAQSEEIFKTDFESQKPGTSPEGLMVLGGQFAIKEAEGNKILELPGAPLEDFGVLFGSAEASDVAVRARVRSEGSKRLAPRFGVGLNGVTGYRLLMAPAQKALQLFKDQEMVATASFEWESGTWTWFHLQLREVSNGKWIVEGRAWQEGASEPGTWAIRFETVSAPTAGKASIWGAPYSSKPIWFDDLSVLRVKE